MLFKVVAGLVVLGLLVWLIGEYFQYLGVAALGASLLIIAGSAVALTGLEIRVGETQSFQYTQIDNTTVRESATVSYDYKTRTLAEILNVGVVASLGLGGLLMLLGTLLLSQTLARQVE